MPENCNTKTKVPPPRDTRFKLGKNVYNGIGPKGASVMGSYFQGASVQRGYVCHPYK